MIRRIFLSNFQVRQLLIIFCSLRNWEFVGEGWIRVCSEGVCEALELSGARGILVDVEIRLEFDSAIIDTSLYLSSVTIYSSVFSIK